MKVIDKKELFKNRVKVITNNLRKKLSSENLIKEPNTSRIKMSYNELVRDVFGKVNDETISKKQIFTKTISKNNVLRIKSQQYSKRSV